MKSINHLVGVLSILCLLGDATADDALLFDLKRVADKPPSDVEKVLGKPSKLVNDIFRGSRGTTYSAVRAAYMNEAVEITFLEGGARYLTIWIQKLNAKYQAYSYPRDGWTLLGDLGLDRNTAPDLSNQAVTRWRDLPGIYEIDVFPATEKKISYVHVFVNRIYE